MSVDAFQRLRNRFPRAIIRPADQKRLSDLRARYQGIDALAAFYADCNGFDAGLNDSVCGDVYTLDKVLTLQSPALRQCRLIPLRGDGCGNYDCFVIGPGLLESAVVFWDHEIYTRPAYLLASSMQTYLEFLVDHLVHEYLPDGSRDPRYQWRSIPRWPFIEKGELTHPWPFDEEWVGSRDPVARLYFSDPAVQSWLSGQEDVIAG